MVKCTDIRFVDGVTLLDGYLTVKPKDKFIEINAEQYCENSASCKNGRLEIKYTALNYAYLLLGKALAEPNDEFSFSLKKKIPDTGIMLDCARNAVIKVSQAKKMMAICALLGYNFFELYVEDCMEVEGEPYFGYMRGRYTQEELKELDSFAKIFDIELVPCVQTLAHLERLFFHWREYTSTICDKRDVLLVDEPRTYELIENVIKTCRKCFTSKRINIGMDEAFDLGLGQFLTKHGYEPRSAIIRRHLKKVLEICKKYDFKPSMWADMFYEDMENGKYEGIPKDIELICWMYGIETPEFFKKRFGYMMPSGATCSFAGCATKFMGFAPYNRFSALTYDSIDVLVECGVSTYLVTAWADDGGETAQFAILPSFCAFSGKNTGSDKGYIDAICNVISGYTAEEFCALDDVNYLNGDNDYTVCYNPCKHLFYADPLIGVEEVAALPSYPMAYRKISKKLKILSERESEYAYLFKTMYSLSRFMELKSYIVEELYYSYKNGDKLAFGAAIAKLKAMIPRLTAFMQAFETQWRIENKEFGFEVQQIRIYGLKGRLQDIAKRADAYLKGELDKIEELEETKYFYPLTEGEYKGKLYHLWAANVTYGKL